MKGSILVVLFALASANAVLETIPYEFYDELKSSAKHEQCISDVNNMLDGAKNLDKWALESWFLTSIYFESLITPYCSFDNL